MEIICESMQEFDRLETLKLDLYECGIEERGIEYLSECLQCQKKLTHLEVYLGNNKIES